MLRTRNVQGGSCQREIDSLNIKQNAILLPSGENRDVCPAMRMSIRYRLSFRSHVDYHCRNFMVCSEILLCYSLILPPS